MRRLASIRVEEAREALGEATEVVVCGWGTDRDVFLFSIEADFARFKVVSRHALDGTRLGAVQIEQPEDRGRDDDVVAGGVTLGALRASLTERVVRALEGDWLVAPCLRALRSWLDHEVDRGTLSPPVPIEPWLPPRHDDPLAGEMSDLARAMSVSLERMNHSRGHSQRDLLAFLRQAWDMFEHFLARSEGRAEQRGVGATDVHVRLAAILEASSEQWKPPAGHLTLAHAAREPAERDRVQRELRQDLSAEFLVGVRSVVETQVANDREVRRAIEAVGLGYERALAALVARIVATELTGPG